MNTLYFVPPHVFGKEGPHTICHSSRTEYEYVRKPQNRHASPAPAAACGCPRLVKVVRGDTVRVLRRDGSTTAGLIDMLALDRSVLWIIQDGGRGRVMICSADHPRVAVVVPAESAC